MLGYYEQFPLNIHRIAHFTTSISNKKLQQTLLHVFHKLNNENLSLENVTIPSLSQCTVAFEYGIAEANSFNYLDDEETNKALKAIQKKPFQIMDFYCALRYHKIKDKKKISLKFDYYMIRCLFNKDLVEMQIFHEKGPRYISPEDITLFITNRINEAFSKRAVKNT